MYFLNHRFQIVKEADVIIIKNVSTDNALVTVKDKGMDFDKFKQIMYYGLNKEEDQSTEALEMIQLIHAFPTSFTCCTDSKRESMFALIRQYTEFFLPTIISPYHIGLYLSDVEQAINEKKACEVYVSLDNSLSYVAKALAEIPFVNVTNEKEEDGSKKDYDIVITNAKGEEQDKLWVEKSNQILFLNVDQNSMKVGPLVFASKFQVPTLEVESVESNTELLKDEELLLKFFLERILYIDYFKLYDKTNKIEFFPARSRICIDRMSLRGYGEVVPMYPKYLED